MAANSILASMAVILTAQNAQFNRILNQSEDRFKKFASSIQNTGAAISNALSFTGISLGAGAAFSVLQSGIKTIADFEQQMATVRAITGATTDEFDQLSASAINLSKSSRFTAIEIAKLQTEYGRLGFTTKEILNATKATLDLSTATGEDLAKSADVLGSTLRAFGKDASETGKVADIMAGSFNKSALGLENFSEAIKYVAPVAAAAGISLEETTALLGTLADNGIRGSMAGTSLRKIISDLGGESGTLAERLQKLAAKGISGADAMDEVGRTAYASLLILAKNTDKTNGLTKALSNVSGEAKATADIVGDTLAGDVDKLKASYDALVLSGGAFSEQLRELVQAGTNLINAFTGSGANDMLTFLQNLVSYTPNIYTLAKAINYLSNLLKTDEEGVKKLIARTNELRKAAIQRGDQKAALEYTKIIAGLSSKYGLLADKALEFKDENPLAPENIDASIENLETLKKQLQDLTNKYIAFSKTVDSTSDLDKLQAIDKEIQGTKSLIDIIEKYRTKVAESNKEKRKEFPLFDATRVSIYSLADAYVELQEQIKKSQENLGKFLNQFNKVSTLPKTVEASDGLKKQLAEIEAANTKTTKTIGEQWIDLGPLVGNAISTIAQSLGEAAVGVGNFGQSIIKALAAFGKQMGEILIAAGTAGLAAKFLVKAPGAAIVAGAALIAISSAAAASLDRAQSSYNSGGGGRTAAASSVSSANSNTVGSLSPRGLEIEVGGEFRIQGNDLVYIINRQNQLNGRTKG